MTEFLIKLFIKDYKNTEKPAVRAAYGSFAGKTGIICNIFLFLLKLITGILTKSISITADAINNLSDAGSSIVSLLGFKLAAKPADREHPYGHGRYEYISALTVAVIILVIGFELLKLSISKIIHPSPIISGVYSIIILVISLFIKLWMCNFYFSAGKKINSKVLRAAAIDSRNDVFSTAAVLVSLSVDFLFKINIDGIIGAGVAVFIISSGISLVKETLNPLIGNAPDEEPVHYIQHKIMSYPGVLGTHDLIVHDYGPGKIFASAHVEVSAEDKISVSHDLIDNIETDFLKEDNLNLIIHMDPVITTDNEVSDLRGWLLTKIKEIHPLLNIHDLKLVPESTHTNMIFDCVIPSNINLSQKELENKIKEKINEKFKNYNVIINFDTSYAPIQK